MGQMHPIYKKNYNELKEIFDVVGEEPFKSSKLEGKVSLPSGKVRGLMKRAFDEKTGVVIRTGYRTYEYQFTPFAVRIFKEEI